MTAASTRQRKVECGALVHLGFRPDATAMALNDALGNREADPGALKLVRTVKPLEDAEELLSELHVETDAVIPNEKAQFVLVLAATHFNERLVPLHRKFESVGQQVDENLFEQRWITQTIGQVAYLKLNAPGAQPFAKLADDLLNELSNPYGLLRERLPAESRETEQVFHELFHAFCAQRDPVQESLPFGRYVGGIILPQQAGKGVHRSQRSP